MLIDFDGYPDKANLDDIHDALEFYAEILLGKRLSKNIKLNVTFVPNLMKRRQTEADCNFEDEDAKVHREFTINIDSGFSRPKTLQCLAHEMVHVKQMAKGELTIAYVKGRGHLNRWKNTWVDENKIGYWDVPWEIEAYGRELGLYVRYDQDKKEKSAKAKKLGG
jgi:hypothetical protein